MEPTNYFYLLKVNVLAVLASAVVCMIIGGLWYSPLLFAKPWMIAMGLDPDDKEKIAEMKKNAPKLYGMAFVACLIAAFVMGKLFFRLSISELPRGLMYSFAIWAGFVSTVQLTNTLFGNKPIKLWLIDTGYQLACYLAMGAIFSLWW